MNKIVQFALEYGMIDDDDVAYHPDKFPFTIHEFREYTEAIYLPLAQDGDALFQYEYPYGYFETYIIPFEDHGNEFYLNIMFGQGSAWTMYTKEEWDTIEPQFRKRSETIKKDEEGEA